MKRLLIASALAFALAVPQAHAVVGITRPPQPAIDRRTARMLGPVDVPDGKSYAATTTTRRPIVRRMIVSRKLTNRTLVRYNARVGRSR